MPVGASASSRWPQPLGSGNIICFFDLPAKERQQFPAVTDLWVLSPVQLNPSIKSPLYKYVKSVLFFCADPDHGTIGRGRTWRHAGSGGKQTPCTTPPCADSQAPGCLPAFTLGFAHCWPLCFCARHSFHLYVILGFHASTAISLLKSQLRNPGLL